MKKILSPLIFTGLGVCLGLALAHRPVSTNPMPTPASETSRTNAMSKYLESVQQALVSGTEATNMSQAEIDRLMNESIKTNLAAQLWYRSRMMGFASSTGAGIRKELNTLEKLRAGRTTDAIRDLEQDLDGDTMVLTEHLQAGEQTKTFVLTPYPAEALQDARDYRVKYPRSNP
jgi:hypothetical protein